MLQLSEFVSSTLEQIIAGAKKAQEAAREAGAAVNPPTRGSQTAGMREYHSGTFTQDVEFHVALTATSSEESAAGLRVGLAWVGGGSIRGGSGSERSEVSRVKFTVPIGLPVQLKQP